MLFSFLYSYHRTPRLWLISLRFPFGFRWLNIQRHFRFSLAFCSIADMFVFGLTFMLFYRWDFNYFPVNWLFISRLILWMKFITNVSVALVSDPRQLTSISIQTNLKTDEFHMTNGFRLRRMAQPERELAQTLQLIFNRTCVWKRFSN